MIRYILKQCKNELSTIYGKWFAYPVIEETLDLDNLSQHMSEHNSPYSQGVIRGVFTDMVKCIKELLLEGKNVKIDDLAIFSIGIKNKKGGATSEEEFSLSKNISNVKLRARATGTLSVKALNLEATLKKATALTGNQSTGAGGETGEQEGDSTDTGN
jgi:predicted histone-like DNA-binding protein